MVIIHGKRRRAISFAAQSRYAVYVLNFLLAFHLALVSYYMSTFLVERGIPQDFVGIIYAVGSMLSLTGIAFAPHLLKKYGNYTNLLSLGLIELLAFVGFVFIENLFVTFVLFLVTFIAPMLIVFSLDIFLEGSAHNDQNTSGVRGLFLTISGIAWGLAPFFGGLIVEGENFAHLFTVSAFVFLPFVFIAASQLERFKDPTYIELNIPKFVRSLAHNKNLRNIFASSFLLRFFYGIMVVYFPLYMHGVLGMSLSQVGIIIAVATTAYVFIEIPVGRLEDRYWGEKEALIIGFAMLAITTGALSFLETTSVVVWVIATFATRVGAALVEVSTEGYFFKQVEVDDSDDVSAFRMLYPLAYIVSPLFGTIVLLFVPLQYIFIITGMLVVTGVLFASQLVDTK